MVHKKVVEITAMEITDLVVSNFLAVASISIQSKISLFFENRTFTER